MARLKIYVSSTTEDLGEFRAQVADLIRRLGHEPLFMGEQSASSRGAVERSLGDVASCDAYLGLFAFRYGYVAPDCEESVTVMEYRKAKECRLPALIFMADEKGDWPARWFDMQHGREVHALRSELMSQGGHTVCLFASLGDLLKKVAQAIADLRPLPPPPPPPPAVEPKVIGDVFQDPVCFKGRTHEIEKIRQLLEKGAIKLIRVLGPSGSGKTALISKFCLGVQDRTFRVGSANGPGSADGIVYFDCRDAADQPGEQLFQKVTELLDAPDRDEVMKVWRDAGRSYADRFRALLGKLQQGRYLLALDNLEATLTPSEKIADECLREFIETCLKARLGPRILAASGRVVLLSERVTPYWNEIHLAPLPKEDGVALLREVDRTGRLDNAPQDLLERAVERCFGLPRAMMSIAAILYASSGLYLEDLIDNPDLFNEKILRNLAREQYAAHSDDHRHVLEALAVYDRPVPWQAVHSLLSRFPLGVNAFDCLGHLEYSHAVTVSGKARTYELHPLLREHAYEQIPDAGTYCTTSCHAAAADYFATIRKRPEEKKTLEGLRPEIEEFDHRLKAGQYDEAARVLDAIDENYLQSLGMFKTVISMRERLLGQGRITDPYALQSNLGNLALMCRRIGRLGESIERFRDTLREIRRAVRKMQRPIREFKAAARADRAAPLIAETARLRKAEDKWLCELGNTLSDAIEIEKALVCYQRGLRIAEKIPDPPGQSRLIGNLAIVHRQLGDPMLALACYEQALTIDRRMLEQAPDAEEERAARKSLCTHLGNSAKPWIALGDFAEAARISDDALRPAREHGFTYAEAFFNEHYGELEVLRKDYPAAIACFLKGVELLDAKEEHRTTSYLRESLGGAYHYLGDLVRARFSYEECQRLDTPETRYRCEVMLGLVDLEEGQLRAAAQHLCEGAARCQELLRKAPRFYEAAYRAALALLANRETDAALDMYRQAKELCAADGVRLSAKQELELLRRAAPGTPGLGDAGRILGDP